MRGLGSPPPQHLSHSQHLRERQAHGIKASPSSARFPRKLRRWGPVGPPPRGRWETELGLLRSWRRNQRCFAPKPKLFISKNRIHLSTGQMVSTSALYRGGKKAQKSGCSPQVRDVQGAGSSSDPCPPCPTALLLTRRSLRKGEGQSLPSPALPSATQKDGDSLVTWTRASPAYKLEAGRPKCPPIWPTRSPAHKLRGRLGTWPALEYKATQRHPPKGSVSFPRATSPGEHGNRNTPWSPRGLNTQAGGRNPARRPRETCSRSETSRRDSHNYLSWRNSLLRSSCRPSRPRSGAGVQG